MSSEDEQSLSNPNEISRRECLTWLARASALAFAGISTVAWAGDGDGGYVKIADLIKISNESAREIKKPSVILTRTAQGVACLSTTCTHRRNALEVDNDGCITCPAHNSTFDFQGNPTGGPATRALTWYQTEISKEGDIRVDTSKTVKQGEWAQLPDWAKPKKK
jgi:Rieske Fe-S protein